MSCEVNGQYCVKVYSFGLIDALWDNLDQDITKAANIERKVDWINMNYIY